MTFWRRAKQMILTEQHGGMPEIELDDDATQGSKYISGELCELEPPMYHTIKKSKSGIDFDKISDFFSLIPVTYALTTTPEAVETVTRAVLQSFLNPTGDGSENARQKQPRRQQPPHFSAPQPQPSSQFEGEISDALKRKDKTRQKRSANRRRVRGGAPLAAAPSKPAVVDPKLESRDDADEIAAFLASQPSEASGSEIIGDDALEKISLLGLLRQWNDDSKEAMPAHWFRPQAG
ncbi:hypothetical protein EDD22DRAFT_968982 [Suillus occidentalis]|nr:hypothetical protein EDD22DRAFT_968982 [Suillus occidentalis]